MKKKKKNYGLDNVLFAVWWQVFKTLFPKRSQLLLYWGLKNGLFFNNIRKDPALSVSAFGHSFPSPIGIGAGVDKKCTVLDELIDLGAAFGEFGSYTLEMENPDSTRTFLLPDNALLTVCDGVPNPGVLHMSPTFLERRYLPHFVGVNITNTASCVEENVKMNRVMSYEDELDLLCRKVAPYFDYITLDFSYPDTDVSRMVGDVSSMLPLLKKAKKAIAEAAPINSPKLLVKLPINMTTLEIPLVCQTVLNADVDGIIMGGALPLYQSKIKLKKKVPPEGTLTGEPVRKLVTEQVGRVYQFTKGKIPIIACGGVFSGKDVLYHMKAGASLVQIGTVLFYEGPAAIKRINMELSDLLKKEKCSSVRDIIGADFR